ncbi:hypothetical protein QE152_g25837 [Popillia japonica]|uniref:Uncharacterized protein n=1 Tax=Popillia japonica TaxID=7064 RepID=A0AAW1K0F4_POPJA
MLKRLRSKDDIILDQRCTFGRHVRYAKEKAEATLSALLKDSVRGSGSEKPEPQYGVVHTQIFYGIPAWDTALQTKKHKHAI